MDSQSSQPREETQPEGKRTGKLFLYIFGIPLILTIILVGVANAMGW